MAESEYIGSLVVKIAELCNLNCSYCYMYNHEDQSYLKRPKMMSMDTYDTLLRRIKDFCAAHQTQMLICFHGGEPFLVGVDRMREMARKAREYLGPYLGGLKVQTNATLMNDEWAQMLKEERIGVGVSLDGTAEINDAMRVDHAGRGSHAKVVRGIEYIKKHDIIGTVLSVIQPGHSGLEAYRHFRELGFQNIVFLFPDISHDSKDRWYGGLGKTPVADFLIPIFDDWFAEDDPKIRVYPFWEIFSLVTSGDPQSDAFGNPNLGYLIIDTDGAIQPLDVLRVCKDGMIESNLNVHQHGFDDLHLGAPLLYQMVKEGIPLCETCLSCAQLEMCGGGYVPHRYSESNGFDNPSAWCADIKKLLTHIHARACAYAV